MSKDQKLPLLDESLLRALELIDSQISRAMERTPAQREESGVQKWKPLEERVEKLSTLILDNFGERVELDSVVVLTQVFTKVLSIICQELGEEGLGTMRSEYVKNTLSLLDIEIQRAGVVFKTNTDLLM